MLAIRKAGSPLVPFAPDFNDPLGLLVHCHEKIEAHLDAMQRAADVITGGPHADLAAAFTACDRASSHFKVAGIKHTDDEELSLFPRMRDVGGSAALEALAAVAELVADHRTADRLHVQFDDCLAELPRDGSATGAPADALAELVARLSALYRPHMRVENEIVFPAARRVLSPDLVAQVGREMRERRAHMLAIRPQGA